MSPVTSRRIICREGDAGQSQAAFLVIVAVIVALAPVIGGSAANGFEIRFDEGLRMDTHRGSPVSVPAGSLSFTVGRRGDDERLAPATVTAVSAGEPGRSARTWFATSRSAELVFLTPALAELTAQVESELAAQILLRTCEWCRPETPSTDASCAFCADVLL